MTQALPPIPRSRSQRWRDFRLRLFPVAVYVAAIAMAVYLWNTQWTPSTFLGEVQSSVRNVSSPLDGMLVNLSVQQFDRVTKGQVIGKVILPPAKATEGLAEVRSALQVMRARMTLDNQRNAQGYEQLRLDQLSQKVDLAVANAKLRFAENELARVEKLRAEKIASEFEYDFARDSRDALVAEVKERTELIAGMDKTLTAMKSELGGNEGRLILDTVAAAIAAQEEELRSASESVLRAPADGIITKIFRNEGEYVAVGEPLLVISGEHAESIIGYIRQPVTYEPKSGDRVLVRSRRGTHRQVASARVVKVSPRVDLLVNMANETGFDPLRERGLAVLINLPEGLTLHPGELVELTIKN